MSSSNSPGLRRMRNCHQGLTQPYTFCQPLGHQQPERPGCEPDPAIRTCQNLGKARPVSTRHLHVNPVMSVKCCPEAVAAGAVYTATVTATPYTRHACPGQLPARRARWQADTMTQQCSPQAGAVRRCSVAGLFDNVRPRCHWSRLLRVTSRQICPGHASGTHLCQIVAARL